MKPTWDAWLETLSTTEREAAQRLAARFRDLGADDPEGWARSEVSENLPQLARFLLLRSIRRDALDGWAAPGVLENIPAFARLLDAGADRDDLVRLVKTVAFEAVFATVNAIDEGHDPDPDADDAVPGWYLTETDAEGTATGRVVGGLHEDLEPSPYE